MDPKAQSIQQMLETLSYAGQSNQILNPTQLIDILTDLPSFEPDLSVLTLLGGITAAISTITHLKTQFVQCRLLHSNQFNQSNRHRGPIATE